MATVYIGHASISENGTVQGEAGDQTGKEVCKRTWYDKNWGFVAIHPDENIREKHAASVEAACANDNIGYSQSGDDNRNTLNAQAKKANYILSKITTPCNCDCSSLQNVCAIASGAVTEASYGSNGWTTSVMKTKLKEAGYIIIEDSAYLKSADYCVRGAIYVKAGSHTVCGLTNGSKYKETLEKAGLTKTTTPTKTTTTSTSSKPTYKTGNVYTTQVDKLNVRKGAGTSYAKVTYGGLTTNAKQHAYGTGQLKKGTKVTCKKTQTDASGNIWMKIPSGWIAAYYKSKVYVK